MLMLSCGCGCGLLSSRSEVIAASKPAPTKNAKGPHGTTAPVSGMV